MALTKVSTDGVKDDAITSGKIPANAVGASELADNAVDTNAIANNAVTAGKTSGVQTTINNNANNRVITGSDTANTLNGESNVVIDSSGNVTIGDSTYGSSLGQLRIVNNASSTPASFSLFGYGNTSTGDSFAKIEFAQQEGGTGGQATAEIKALAVGTDERGTDLTFTTRPNTSGSSPTERMRVDSSGNIGIGTTSPTYKNAVFGGSQKTLHISGTAAPQLRIQSSTSDQADLFLQAGNSGSDAYIGNAASNGDIIFSTNNGGTQSNRLRIKENGDVNINNTGDLDTYRLAGSSSGIKGHLLMFDGRQANTTPQSQLQTLNRLVNDGALITFSQNGNQEGNISVSGSSVSYNGGNLSRWSQLKGISSTDKSARPTIYQGTVMSNLDDLCEWSHSEVLYKEDVLYTKEDTIPEGKSEGDIKHAKGSVLRAAYTEENQQLNMTKVSDVDGDKNVAGVFWAWDDEDDEIVNDFYIAMTGDMVIRVAASTTVARGDLLISAGDGTAKPQDDDIVRSSTIAKIISTTFTATYEDGSKAYPCVLMAC